MLCNLLAWRSDYYRHCYLRFKITLFLFILGIVLLFSWLLLFYYQQLSVMNHEFEFLSQKQQQLQQHLQQQITLKKELEQFKQQSQPVNVSQNEPNSPRQFTLFTAITQHLPDELGLTSLSIQKQHWRLAGKTFSMTHLLDFVDFLDKELGFKYTHVTTSSAHYLYEFVWEGDDG